MAEGSVHGSSYGSVSTTGSFRESKRLRDDQLDPTGHGSDLLEHESSFENAIFGVLYTLRYGAKGDIPKRVRWRWIFISVLLELWQLFPVVVDPARQGWTIPPDGPAWTVASIFKFTWLAKLGYGAYLAALYTLVTLLALSLIPSVWLAWCFQEHRCLPGWPVKVLQVLGTLLFQTFDVAALNLLELGISCRFTGGPEKAQGHYLDSFPRYSCARRPHITHAVATGLFLALYIGMAVLYKLSQVEVNPLSRHPEALGQSYTEVVVFAFKVLLTLVPVFIGWQRVAACLYVILSLALVWQLVRWSPHLVSWVNYLRSGVAVSIAWCSATLMLLVFHPSGEEPKQPEPPSLQDLAHWNHLMTLLMAIGLAPAFCAGALMSYGMLRYITTSALKAMTNAKSRDPLLAVIEHLDSPRDVEIASRSCRVWRDPLSLDRDAVNSAQNIIKTGLAAHPSSAFVVLLHGNFLIEVLGVTQAGSRRIEDAQKLEPNMMCRYVMFVRRQQASGRASGNGTGAGGPMDLMSYVEYQRKHHTIVRLHREALQAMCNFWRALDSHSVSFTRMSRLLGRIESSVARAQTAYRVVLGTYGHDARLARLYSKFLGMLKNDPWSAAKYAAEADQLEEAHESRSGGPTLPDGSSVARMNEMEAAVVALNAAGEVKMANKHACHLFGHKRGSLEGKPLATLLAPHCVRWLADRLSALAGRTSLEAATATEGGESGLAVMSGGGAAPSDAVVTVVGLHPDRLAFPIRLSLSKVSGVGEDSTFIAMLEAAPPIRGLATLWVGYNGTVVACDPQFVMAFGWRPSEISGNGISSLVCLNSPAPRTSAGGLLGGPPCPPGGAKRAPSTVQSANETLKRLIAAIHHRSSLGSAECGADGEWPAGTPPGPDEASAAEVAAQPVEQEGARCWMRHKYSNRPVCCLVSLAPQGTVAGALHELHFQTDEHGAAQLLVVDRRGGIVHVSEDLLDHLTDSAAEGGLALRSSLCGTGRGGSASGARGMADVGPAGPFMALPGTHLAAYTLGDFLPPPWRDMHVAHLKMSTSMTPASRAQWSCRTEAPQGPTLELRTTGGKPLFMRVSVTTADVAGELNHVIRMTTSSLASALSERRLRLQLGRQGLITAVDEDTPAHLLGVQPQQLLGRNLFDLIDRSPPWSRVEDARASSAAPRNLADVFANAATSPGRSWRVQLLLPPKPNMRKLQGMFGLSASHIVKQVVMQVHVDTEGLDDGVSPGDGSGPVVIVDLWPSSSVTGVLELDHYGRVRAVLEEQTRPAGLLFGVPSQSLVGSMLGELVALPQSCGRVADLLTPNGARKSSMKRSEELTTKVGPVHVLQATHADGHQNKLMVQVVGKPGAPQALHVVLRTHLLPLPSACASACGSTSGAAHRAPLPPPPPAREPTAPGALTLLRTAPTPAGSPPPGRTQVPTRCLLSPAAPAPTPPQLTAFQAAMPAAAASPAMLRLPSSAAAAAAAVPTAVPRPPALGPKGPEPKVSTPDTHEGCCQQPLLSGASSKRPSVNDSAAEAVLIVAVRRPAMLPAAGGMRRGRPAVDLDSAAVYGYVEEADAEADAAAGARQSYPARAASTTALALGPLADIDGEAVAGASAGVAGAAGGGRDGTTPDELLVIRRTAASALSGRGKLGGLVKAVGVQRGSYRGPPDGGGGRAGAGAGRGTRRQMSSGALGALWTAGGKAAVPEGQRPRVVAPCSSVAADRRSGGDDAGAVVEDEEAGAGGAVPCVNMSGVARHPTPTDSSQSPSDSSSSQGGGSGPEPAPDRMAHGNGKRVSAWVQSAGAFFQNSAALGDVASHAWAYSANKKCSDGAPRTAPGGASVNRCGGGSAAPSRCETEVVTLADSSETTAVAASKPAGRGPGSPPAGGAPAYAAAEAGPSSSGAGADADAAGAGPGPDDDAASEGSGASGLSADGDEFRRGRRYRKFNKLIDAAPSQQAHKRLMLRAVCMAIVLCAVHVTCFALTIASFQTRRQSMVQLSHSGLLPMYTGQVTADVRSLDLISRNRTLPTLYTWDDVPFFVARVSKASVEIQSRMMDILTSNTGGGAQARMNAILYGTQRTVWSGKAEDGSGSDLFTNVTVWDFFTQFVLKCKDIEQNHEEWLAAGLPVGDTPAGQFILKSGPDLWKTSRKILDAMLYVALDDAEAVDRLQKLFLAVDGIVMTLLAASYLAYLLRGVGVERYQLYETFMCIPLGLARSLAAQSTIPDEEDEEDEDEETRLLPAGSEPRDDVDDDEVDDDLPAAAINAAAPKAKPLLQQQQQQPQRPQYAVSQGTGSGGAGEGASPLPSAGIGSSMRRGSALFSKPPGLTFAEAVDAARRRNSKFEGPHSTRRRQQKAAPRMSEASAEERLRDGCWGRLAWSLRRGAIARLITGMKRRNDDASATASSCSKRKLRRDSMDTVLQMVPFVVWAVLVISIYVTAVAKLTSIVHVVAVHSVSNFIAARTYRAVFFCQELAATLDPAELPARRAAVATVWKVVRDAWFTLQLGADAQLAAGPDVEQFALVTQGMAHGSPAMEELFFASGDCHRLPDTGPCPPPGHRFHDITRTGVDTVMQHFMMHIRALAVTNGTRPPGLSDRHFDFVYNVGSRDLIDGATKIQDTHLDIILAMFQEIFTLHVMLFVFFWVVCAGFFFLLLLPLLQKITRERCRIAGLVSQLPPEFDAEKLLTRVLVGAASSAAGHGSAGEEHGGGGGGSTADGIMDADPAPAAAAAVAGTGALRAGSSPDASRPKAPNGA